MMNETVGSGEGPLRTGRDRARERLDLATRVEADEALEERVADLALRREHVPALRERDEDPAARGPRERAQRGERVGLVVEEADRDRVVEALLSDGMGEEI